MIVRDALIIGGGLAGLSAAIALARRGVEVTVATLEDRAGGTSVTITNRAVDAIEALGVLDACLADGLVPTDDTSIFSAMMDSTGRRLSLPQPPPARADKRLPSWIAIYRPDLSRILTDAAIAAGVIVRDGVSFSALTEQGGQVAVDLTDGTHSRFDLVVGADGSHSATRRVIHPTITPTYTGTMSFRLVLEDGPPGPAGFYAPPDGPGQLATVRLPGNRLYLAAGKRMENRRLDQAEAVAVLDAVLALYVAPLIQGIRARLAEDPPVIARPFEYCLVPAPWHRGRVALIGDAAHATTPNLASGGSIALEDGVVLAEELAKADSVAAGLDAFTTRRYARCALVVETGLAIMRAGDAVASAALRGRALAELIRPY